LGRRSAVVGTLGIGEPPPAAAAADAPPALASTGLTTPDPITLQSALADFAAQGFSSCAIEASSIGIAEHRLAGTRVAVAVFTNFTQDHLDYHGDMVAYWQAKAQLFAWPGLRAAAAGTRPDAADRRGAGSARGRRRLRAHARRAREGALCAEAARRRARRQALVRVRLRRQPRPGEAPADGRDRDQARRARRRH